MSILTDEHVEKHCKPGNGTVTCMFLSMTPDGWGCEKGTSIGELIKERGDAMEARGDNCPGI